MGGIEITSSNSTKLTPYQIAEAFPDECNEYLPRLLPVLRSKQLDYQEQVRRIQDLQVAQNIKDFYMIFVDASGILNTRKRIETYEKAMEIIKNKEIDVYLANVHAVASAKATPIETLYGFEKMKMSTSRVSALCPFHSERTPSFVIYRKNNTYHCFSCKVSGDSIDFMMRINKMDFKQAVKELSGWNS